MKLNGHPILEFDPTRTAVIEPTRAVKERDMPEHAVLCFFQDVINRLRRQGKLKRVGHAISEMGRHPIFAMQHGGKRMAVFQPGLGAPFGGAFLEEVIARGGRKFIACGGAGVLDRDIAVGHLVVPTAAVRDEGTSYHYLSPGRLVKAGPRAVAAIRRTLASRGCPFVTGYTWTTDAVYRETRAKVEARRREGCLTVEMEAAAFFAVARFRKVEFGQILYAGDDVGSDEWDSRDWQSRMDVRERLFWLAVESCVLL